MEQICVQTQTESGQALPHWPLAVQGAIMISLETSACGTSTTLLPCPAMADGHGLCGVASLPQSLHYTATSVWSHGKACIGHPPQVSD
jgi:hypothetical protein